MSGGAVLPFICYIDTEKYVCIVSHGLLMSYLPELYFFLTGMELVLVCAGVLVVVVAEADVTPQFFPPFYPSRHDDFPSTTPYFKDFLRLNATANANLPSVTTPRNVELLRRNNTHSDNFPSPDTNQRHDTFPFLAPLHQREDFLPPDTTHHDDILRLDTLGTDDSPPRYTTQKDDFDPLVSPHHEDLMPMVTPDNNNLDDFEMVGMVDAGESIPTLFHKLINTGLESIDSSESSLLEAEARILQSDDQHILAAVISTGSPEKTTATERSFNTHSFAREGVQDSTKSRSESGLPRQGWVLLSYKKKDQQETPPSKEEQVPSHHQIQTWEDWPIEKLPTQHEFQNRQKQSKEKVSNERQFQKQDEKPIVQHHRRHYIGKRSLEYLAPGHHKRQKRFTFKNKLRSIAVPLSVFNFLGFLPVRVPGLPYHEDLPSPDHSYYNTMHEVYIPQHYRRRKGYRY